jgi:hypothetical protein
VYGVTVRAGYGECVWSRCVRFSNAELIVKKCLWYNKSRKTSRVCPCCRRLYRLGDVMSNLLEEISPSRRHDEEQEQHPLLRTEQEISGLCKGLNKISQVLRHCSR